jgi:ABC-type transport system involved in multi-copper enzyme maturation permease subunit
MSLQLALQLHSSQLICGLWLILIILLIFWYGVGVGGTYLLHSIMYVQKSQKEHLNPMSLLVVGDLPFHSCQILPW